MKILYKLTAFIFIASLFFACETDEDKMYNLDYVKAPSNVSAIFDVTTDNTGLVSITPNAEGAQNFVVNFGDGSDTEEYKVGEAIEHTYDEGVYNVKVTAVGITGLETEFTQELNVTFKAPENVELTVTNDDVNPRIVSVSATADYATVFEIYWGDVEEEEPTLAMPEETVTHTYEAPGDYDIKVIAKSAGAATTEYTETVNVPEAADPMTMPIDFESFTINYAFSDFGGVASSVVDNPDAGGINSSDKVGLSTKTAGAETWAGTILTLGDPLNFADKTFKVKVWSPKSGAVVKLKVENLDDGDINHEVDATTTVANEWEELSFDFTAIDTNNEYQKVVLFFDFGNAGDDSNYYFDDIKLVTEAAAGTGIEGIWKVASEVGAIGVGPALGDISWWSIDEAGVTERACYFDDTYVFGLDGTFENVLGSDTWVEGWQGGSDACGAPVAPHDGSNPATFVHDTGAGTVTLNGVGAFLGLPKVTNNGELSDPADAPVSVTYDVTLSEGNTVMTVDITIDGGSTWWRYKMVKVGEVSSSPLAGTWSVAAEAGSIGVGPALGDISWWSIDDPGVTQRACYFDDTYVFGADGSFQNVQGGDTWLETWQSGVDDACGTPVAPHDGSNPATYSYDSSAGTVTLNGVGAYLGLPKVTNDGELSDPADAPSSIVYDVTLSEGNTVMTVDITIGGGTWWRFKLVKN